SERTDGYSSSIGFFARSAVDASALANADEKMRITSGGNVGIGGTPTGVLDLFRATDSTGLKIQTGAYGGGYLTIFGEDKNLAGVASSFDHTERFNMKTTNLNGGAGADRTMIAIHREGWSDGDELVLLPSGGNVGIGTIAPNNKLVVSNGNAGGLEINPVSGLNGGTTIFTYDRTTPGYKQMSFAASNFRFTTATTDPALDILANGNVGIGTTAPGQTLDVNGTIQTKTAILNVGFFPTGVATSSSINLFTNAQGLYKNWNIGTNGIVGGAFTVTPSSAVDGNVFSTPAMTILQAGNVGIGTTAPGSKLEVNGDAKIGTYLGVGANPNAGYSLATAANGITIASGGTLDFGLGNARIIDGGGSYYMAFHGWNGSALGERMRITGAGKVGIGTTAPGYNLEVGNSGVSGIVARFVNSSGSCDINPQTTALVCPSDMNLKKNITTIKDDKEFALQTVPADIASKSTFDKIMTLTPIKYNWKTESDTDVKHDGFIAQEVEQIFPDLVYTDPVTGFKSLATTNLIPYTIEAIQEMNLKLEEVGDMTKPNIFRSAITSWLENSSNKITRIFTGEVCLTDADGQTECINRSELKQLKGLMNASGTASAVPTSTTTTGSTPPATPVVEPTPIAPAPIPVVEPAAVEPAPVVVEPVVVEPAPVVAPAPAPTTTP
ncbi:MAG: tail fiber domain-containing protein, partial [Candidatus Paceibacterota bacterium]